MRKNAITNIRFPFNNARDFLTTFHMTHFVLEMKKKIFHFLIIYKKKGGWKGMVGPVPHFYEKCATLNGSRNQNLISLSDEIEGEKIVIRRRCKSYFFGIL